MKTEISLSPKAVEIINGLLSNGSRVQISFNDKTGELIIHKIPPFKTEYRAVVTNR